MAGLADCCSADSSAGTNGVPASSSMFICRVRRIRSRGATRVRRPPRDSSTGGAPDVSSSRRITSPLSRSVSAAAPAFSASTRSATVVPSGRIASTANCIHFSLSSQPASRAPVAAAGRPVLLRPLRSVRRRPVRRRRSARVVLSVSACVTRSTSSSVERCCSTRVRPSSRSGRQPYFAGDRLDLLLMLGPMDALANLVSHFQDLVDAGPPAEAAVMTLLATFPLVEHPGRSVRASRRRSARSLAGNTTCGSGDRWCVRGVGATTPLKRRRHQVCLDAHVNQPDERPVGVVGVQRGQHQVAGEGRLYGHAGGVSIADFADHDDVRVLTQDRAQRPGENSCRWPRSPGSG